MTAAPTLTEATRVTILTNYGASVRAVNAFRRNGIHRIHTLQVFLADPSSHADFQWLGIGDTILRNISQALDNFLHAVVQGQQTEE